MSSNPTGTLSGLHAWLGSRSILSIAARIEGIGLAEATYVFDPGTFIEDEQTRQMRCRPTIESEFSVLVALRPEGRIETFKYRASELICEACGPDFQTAMIHTSPGGKQSTSPVRPRLAPRAWRLKTTYRARRQLASLAVEGSRPRLVALRRIY